MAPLKAIRGGRGIQRGLTLLKTCAGSARPRGPTITSEETLWAFGCCHPNPAGGGEKTDTQSGRAAGQRYRSPNGRPTREDPDVKKPSRLEAFTITGGAFQKSRLPQSLHGLRH